MPDLRKRMLNDDHSATRNQPMRQDTAVPSTWQDDNAVIINFSLGGVDGSRHNHAVGLKPTATFAAEGTASSAQQATALSPPGILLSSDDGDDDNNADVQPPLCEWQQRRSAGPTPAIRPARLIGPHSRRHLEPARLISWQAAASQSRRQACVTVAFGDRSAQVRIWTQSRCCNEFNQRTSDSQSVVTVCTQPEITGFAVI